MGVDPAIMGYGAVAAAKKALERAKLSVKDIDLWEVNEAFSTLPLMQIKALGIDPARMNVNGGALCIGIRVEKPGRLQGCWRAHVPLARPSWR